MGNRHTKIRSSQILNTLPSDIDAINSITDLYYIRKASGQDKWEWVAITNNLSELDDVDFDTGTPADNYALIYDNATGKWKAEKQQASQVDILQVGSPTYTTLQDLIDTLRSAGVISGGGFTDNGDGTITVASGTGLIKITNSAIASLKSFNWSADNSVALVDETTNYIMIDYNSGSPQIISSDTDTSNERTIFKLGLVFREGNLAHLFDNGVKLSEWEKDDVFYHQEADGIILASGGIIGESGTRNVTVTSAVLYSAHKRFPTNAFDSSETADEFEYYYYDGDATGGGVWVETFENQIDNTYYNDIATGLTELTVNRYGVHWVYLCNDGHVMIVYGQGNYTLPQAQDSTPPASLYEHVANFSTFIGRIIIQKGDSSFTEISSIGEVSLSHSAVVNHNDLANIQGGQANEYYHFNNADYLELTQWLDNVTLGSDGKLTLPNGVAINEFSSDGTLVGDSDLAVPTEKAVKTYVDNNIPDLSTSVDDFTIKYENSKLKIADRIEYNIMLLAFYRAVDNSKSIYNLLDGFIDEYEDETGIDTGASTNEDYDSTNDLYQPLSTTAELDSNTKLMIHGNDGDSSGQAHDITYFGTAQIDATTYKWEDGSLLLDGNSDYLSLADSADWDICASAVTDRTIDFWVKHTDHVDEEDYIVHYENDTNRWQLLHNHGTGLIFTFVSGGGSIISTDWGGEITDTNWHHIALIKVASKYAIYKDGTQVNYVDDSSIDTLTGTLQIGRNGYSAGSNYLDGNMDGIRINHSNIFNATPLALAETGYPDTISVPTSAPTADGDTKLLLNFEEGDNYGGHNVEPQGGARVDRTTKKWGDGSWYFDGTDDYLELLDSPDWDIVGSNSDNKTIDFWVKHTDHVSAEGYIGQREDAGNYWLLLHLHGTGVRFLLQSNSSTIIDIAGGEITDTNWHHIALIKVASKYAIYKDGTQVSYVQDSSIDTFTASLLIGQYEAQYFLDGYMDEIRIQYSNIFEANPVVGLTDTIGIPTSEYTDITASYNMTLISNSQIAVVSPSDARIVIFEEDVDSITLNTDIKAYVTRENGTGATWEQVTLVDEGNYEGSKRVLSGIVDLDVTGMGAGTDMAYKIETLNTKDLKIHGTGVNWD